jgi:energy-coupling factor transporter transmembrane protein EcfT
MAELTAFSYHPGSTFLHGLDNRLKLVCMAAFSLASLAAGPRGLLLACMMLVLIISGCRISFRSMIAEMRYFIFLVLFVFIARALTQPGAIVIKFGFLEVTKEGLFDGFLVSWRLVTVVLLGLVFVATSRPAEIRTAVAWFLRPVPFIPEQRVAIMIGLLVRFVPVIFGQVRETTEALRARGFEMRKNPAYRIRKLAIPLAWRTFDNADKLVDAMSARCYSENRTSPEFSFDRREWTALILAAVIIGLIVIL